MAWRQELNRSVDIAKQAFDVARLALANTTLILQQKYPEIEATMTSEGNVIFMETDGGRNEFFSVSEVEKTYGKMR